jgi:hypothetical protein
MLCNMLRVTFLQVGQAMYKKAGELGLQVGHMPFKGLLLRMDVKHISACKVFVLDCYKTCYMLHSCRMSRPCTRRQANWACPCAMPFKGLLLHSDAEYISTCKVLLLVCM